MSHTSSRRQHLAALLAAFFLLTIGTAFAAPPGSPYFAGETLSPTCAPGDTNCTVATSGLLNNGSVLIGDGSSVIATSSGLSWNSTTNTLHVTNLNVSGTATSSAFRAGKIITTGTTPSLSSCGTSPSIVGNDTAGTITVGAGIAVTTCTLTFSSAFPSVPVCMASTNNAGIMLGLTSVSASSVTFGLSLTLGGGQIYYHCLGVQ